MEKKKTHGARMVYRSVKTLYSDGTQELVGVWTKRTENRGNCAEKSVI
jgi:hypothetical protein